jgi:hypothetical protein
VIRLHLVGDGDYRFEYTDTGVFDVLERGSRIVWYPGSDAPLELGRSDVLGRVLAIALHAAGYVCLHASAVAVAGEAVAFLAPKFFGKSTLALALTYAGGRLITDDTLAVHAGHPPTCLPGVHTVRLREESAQRLVGDPPAAAQTQGDRHLVNWLPESSLATTATPLAALYLLSPVPATEAEAVRRVPLSPVQAAIAMVQHTKIQHLSRGAQAAEHFERSSSLAASVATYRLEIVRDMGRLDDVVRQLLAWHALEPAQL